MSLDFYDLGGTTVGGEPLTFGTGGQLFLGDQPVFSAEFTPDSGFRFFNTPAGGGGALDFGLSDFGLSPDDGFRFFETPGVTAPSLFDAPSFGPGQVQDDVLMDAIRQGLQDPDVRQALNSVSINARGDGLVKSVDGTPADQGFLQKFFLGPLAKVGITPETLGKALFTLGMGGVGLAVAAAAGGGGGRMELPPPQAPSPAQQASREALNRALTGGTAPSAASQQPTLVAQAMRQQQVLAALTQVLGRAPTDQELAQAMQALPAPGVPTGPSLAQALGPGATGQEDLQTAFRLALAGQRNLADLALAGTGRELAADVEQAPAERAIRLGALGEVPGLLAPTGNLAPALATGQTISRNITDLLRPIPMRLDPATGQFVADLSSPTLPDVLRDPVQAALQQETLRVLGGQTPTPELEQAEREETQALQNRLFRQLGPGYELSTTGSQLLNQLRDSQQIRRNQYRLQTVGALAPQELERRRFGESATQGRLGTLLPAELDRAQFAENVRGRGLGERVALTDLGRRPVSQLSTTLGPLAPVGPLLGLGDAEAERRFQQELQTKVALSSFDAEQRERAARAQGISSLFGTAAGTAFAPPSISLFPRSA